MLSQLKIYSKQKKENSLFCVYDRVVVNLIKNLRLQFSNLNEHIFKHGFSDSDHPTCVCGTEVEPTEHFPLRY